jgi:hypothetical protein
MHRWYNGASFRRFAMRRCAMLGLVSAVILTSLALAAPPELGPVRLLSRAAGDGYHPRVARSGGTVFAAWDHVVGATVDETRILVRRSADNGRTWQAERAVDQTDTGQRYPDIAVAGQHVYVTWLDIDNGANAEVWFARSTNGGDSYDVPAQLGAAGSPDDAARNHPRVAAFGDNVYVTWASGGAISDILFLRSTNNGVMWQPQQTIELGVPNSRDARVGAAGNRVYVAWTWQQNPAADWQVKFRRSTDGGANFGFFETLSKADAIDSVTPEIDASGARVAVVYTDRLGIPKVRARISNDSATTWGAIRAVSPAGVSAGEPAISVAKPWIEVAFVQSGGAKLLLRGSSDGGKRWARVVELAATAGGPFSGVAITGQGARSVAAWGETANGAGGEGAGHTRVRARGIRR